MSHFRHVLFFVTCLFTFLKSICCSPFIEQKQNNKIKGLYDETVVDRMSADLADKLLSLDVYEFSQGPYNMTYFSSSSLHLKTLKNKYISSYPFIDVSYYRYQKFDSKVLCFLFISKVNVKYTISATLYNQKVSIYNLDGAKLAQNSNSGPLSYNFIKNQIYIISIDYLLIDLDFMQLASLKLEVR